MPRRRGLWRGMPRLDRDTLLLFVLAWLAAGIAGGIIGAALAHYWPSF
jgi:hypothetical protein